MSISDVHCVKSVMEKKTSTDRVRAFRERKRANKPPRKAPKSTLERSREYRARQRALKKHGGQHNLTTTSNTLEETMPSLSEDTVSGKMLCSSYIHEKMEPEKVWLQEEVHIKQEPQSDIKEEPKSEDEAENMEFLSHTEVKQEQPDCELTPEVDNPINFVQVLMSETAEHENNPPASLLSSKSSSKSQIVAGSADVLGSSDNGHSSLAVPSHRPGDTSESDASQSEEIQHTDVKLHSDPSDVCNRQMEQHEFGIDPNKSKYSECKEIQQQYPCNICNKLFPRRGSLKIHQRTHTGHRPYICNFCNKSFTQDGHLKLHVRTHTGEQPYTCDVCGISFSKSGSLTIHMRIHTGDRPYVCEVCNKSFTVIGNLTKHVRTHTGQRPYTCEICNKSFTEHGSLKKHLRTHTGQRPYTCEICNRSFSERGNLKIHVRIHTGQRPYSCDICNSSFTQHEHLKRHMNSHVGQ